LFAETAPGRIYAFAVTPVGGGWGGWGCGVGPSGGRSLPPHPVSENAAIDNMVNVNVSVGKSTCRRKDICSSRSVSRPAK
jgi:hypothetical protein